MGNSQPRYYKPDKKVEEDDDDKDDIPTEKEEATEEEMKSVLRVLDVDFQSYIPENTREHHTDKYDCTEKRESVGFGSEPRLVVRRGQPFKFTIKFDRPFSLEKDDMVIMVKTGKIPELKASTHAKFEINETKKFEYKADEWGGKLLSKEGNNATIEVQPAADCAIGWWRLTVITRSKVQGDTKVYMCEDPEKFIILFNPWCKDDLVYMKDEDQREEYVLNDQGAVFRGHAYRPKGKVWNFGQFEDGIVNICLWLLKKCFNGKSYHNFSDPIRVARAISKMVNCNDDDGVLVGNWSGEYDDGKTPGSWSGSPAILQQYWKDQSVVKYGQCWVFSGLTTTVCRALGIPALSVTNYASAHDNNADCVISKNYKRDKDGKLEHIGGDSVWNFHVWNEVWMKRPDISGAKGKYDGWQAIDATPQEHSDGVFQCGPAPLTAIKEGHVNVPYDTQFIFAEVNADVIRCEKVSKKTYKKMDVKTDKVGKKLSAKKADGKKFDAHSFWGNRDDRTDEYKYPEGSDENRNAVLRACIGSKNVSDFYTGGATQEKEDVEFKLLHDPELILGKDIEVKLTAKNVSEYRKTLSDVRFRFIAMKYTGQNGKVIKAEQQKPDEELEPNKEHEFKCTLPAKAYYEAIDDSRSLCIQAFSTVEKTRTRPLQNCIKSHEVVLLEPDVDVKMPSKCRVGEEFEVCMEFENPLDMELTGCTAGYEGRGFKHVTGVKQPNMPANGKGEMKFKMCGKKKGKFNVLFTFHSNELWHLSGNSEIEIE